MIDGHALRDGAQPRKWRPDTSRFWVLDIDSDRVVEFAEKPQAEGGWINGGFMVLEHEVLGYLSGDTAVLEHEPVEQLPRDGQMMAYSHHGLTNTRGRDDPPTSAAHTLATSSLRVRHLGRRS